MLYTESSICDLLPLKSDVDLTRIYPEQKLATLNDARIRIR